MLLQKPIDGPAQPASNTGLTFPPCAELAGLVDAIWIHEIDGRISRQSGDVTILPSTSMVACFQYRDALGMLEDGEARYMQSALTGLQRTAQAYRAAGDVGSVAVRFTPWGAASFFGLDGLADRRVALDEVWPAPELRHLEGRLADATDHRERILLVQGFLLRHRRGAPDPVVRAAAQRTVRALGAVSVRALATETGLSERQFERRFKRSVGIAPKQFARIARFQSAVSRIRAHQLAATAQDLGFSDQAHFTRDVCAMAGTTPQRLRQRLNFLLPPQG